METPEGEHKMGTGTGARAETRAVVAETETGTGTGTGTRTGSERAEERRGSVRKGTRVVDAMWETGETWVEREKNVDKKVLAQ